MIFNYKHDQKRSASALIIVLWVITMLSILIGSFAFDAHVEARITSYYRKRAKALHLAKSGVEIAHMLMEKSTHISEADDAAMDDQFADDRWFEPAKSLKKGSVKNVVEELGDGTITISIVTEPARRNINKLGQNEAEIEQTLESIFEVGGITEDLNMWPELIESFLDWVDEDNLPRVDGGETEDYYSTTEDPSKPKRAKNGPFDTVGELLLVKGYSSAILYGGQLDGKMTGGEPVALSGIHDLLTVYGSDGKVNINAADTRVLMTLPGVDELTAGAIIEEREGFGFEGGKVEEDPFRSVDDLFARVADLDPRLKNYVTTGVGVCRITSVGEVGGVKKTISCIAQYSQNNKEVTILRWLEQD